jgi:hypothetical protein
MPWRECRKMDERLRFIARLLDGEKMAVLCREFDISRTTGYKIFSRAPDLGSAKDSREDPPLTLRDFFAGCEHRARGSGSSWLGGSGSAPCAL